jgi:hypothetical protein
MTTVQVITAVILLFAAAALVLGHWAIWVLDAISVVEGAQALPEKVRAALRFLAEQPALQFYFSVFALCAVGAALLLPPAAWKPLLPEWLTASDTRKKEMGNVTINGSAVSHNQSGGITAGNYINQAPQPELKIVSDANKNNANGTHTKAVRLQVVSPYAPGLMVIVAKAAGLLSGDIHPVTLGHIMAASRIEGDKYIVDVTSPVGIYELAIQTKRHTPVEITYGFQ